MDQNHSSSANFYAELEDVGFSPLFIAMNGPKALIGIVGILFNVSLVLVTVFSRSLHGSCNILLATDSLGFALYLLSPLVSLGVVLFGPNFVPLSLCFVLQIVPLLGLNISSGMMLFISNERLLSITFPVWFNRLNPRVYLPMLIAFSLLIALLNIYRLSLAAMVDGNLMVMCNVPDCYRGEAGQHIYLSGLFTLCICVCCYLGIWAQLRHKLCQSSKVDPATRRLFKSLLVLICIIVFGWIVDILGRLLLLPLLPLSSHGQLLLSGLLSNFALVASSSNAPVLYCFSRDYRFAYNAMLNRFFAFAGFKNLFVSQMPLPSDKGLRAKFELR